jgi:ferredoxin
MMMQIAFVLALVAFIYLARKRYLFIQKGILLGKPVSPNTEQGWNNVLLYALGQKKMFEKPLVGILHAIVYFGFFVVNIEVIEIILDGLLGTHRILTSILPIGLYQLLINLFEVFALGVIVSCVIFLIRRNVVKLPRFQAKELKGWAYKDANLILLFEIALMSAFLKMNAADSVLQQREVGYAAIGNFWISSLWIPIYENFGTSWLIAIERIAWWFHILGIFGFAVYVTYSKHLHIILGFVNIYYSPNKPVGAIENMPSVTAEVKSMMGLPTENTDAAAPPARFGAKDVTDLTWKNLLDAFSCTECGRCSSVCPASQTGKLLSPRKIMMDTRDRAESLAKGNEPEKTLYENYITNEELFACTSCNACVEACPVGINPLEIIIEMRRYAAMEESKTPQAWNVMFANIENNATPWSLSANDRANWIKTINNK